MPDSDKDNKPKTQLSLIKNPFSTIYYFSLALKKYFGEFLMQHYITALVLLLISFVYYGLHLIKGPHVETLKYIDEVSLFVGWWVGLGIASSVGLGTGLHTFVLYLGPHIANVALIAGECYHVPKMLPSRWNFHYFEDCTREAGSTNLAFLSLLAAVQLEGFLWGFGTAIGELPPYYVARAAALANQDDEFEDPDKISSFKSF